MGKRPPVRTSFKKGDPRTREMAIKGAHTPKSPRFEMRMQEWLEKEVKDGITIEDAMRSFLWKEAKGGNIQAIREVFDRAFGKAKLHMAVTGENDGPVEHTIKVVFEEDNAKR